MGCAAVRCAPPANKPTTSERDACRPFLERELEALEAVRVMVALGMLFILLSGIGWLRRNKLESSPWYLRMMVLAIPLPYIANEAGWIVAEVGRQPWIVYGLLRTTDGLSENVTSGQVVGSLALFGFIYLLLLALFVYLLNEKIQQGPDVAPETPKP